MGTHWSLSHHQKDSPRLALIMSFSPSNLFLSKILWNSNTALKKRDKLMSLYPHFLHTRWHWRNAHFAAAVHTGSSSSLLPGSCCPEAEAEALQVVTGSQGRSPLVKWWRKAQARDQNWKQRSPLEHSGLALLLPGPLLPPSHGTALCWEWQR